MKENDAEKYVEWTEQCLVEAKKRPKVERQEMSKVSNIAHAVDDEKRRLLF